VPTNTTAGQATHRHAKPTARLRIASPRGPAHMLANNVASQKRLLSRPGRFIPLKAPGSRFKETAVGHAKTITQVGSSARLKASSIWC